MFIDSHCHLDFSVFEQELDTILQNAYQNGVKAFLVPATTLQSWDKVKQLSCRYSAIRTAYGLHPYFLTENSVQDIAHLERFSAENNPVAIGEIGLDFWPDQVSKNIQVDCFKRQLSVAENLSLPVIIHARKSYDDVFSIVRKYRLSGGVIHAFTGSLVQAQRFIDLGFILGCGGSITYLRARKTRHLFKTLSNNDFILETDAPDMPLYGYQGKKNTPSQIVEIAKTLSDLRAQSLEEIAYHNYNNVMRAFPAWNKEENRFVG